MSCAPIRPVFHEGQRLTAERLTQAFEYLRDFVRRVLLAPLSAGVAAGFEIAPVLPSTDDHITIEPGLAIDGRGMLLLLCERRTFTITELNAAIGGPLQTDEAIRVGIALREVRQGKEPCAPHLSSSVIENVEFVFERVPLKPADLLFQAGQEALKPNCIEPWEDVQKASGSGDCSVTLGHVFAIQPGVTTSTFFRQGVCPRFSVIRNSAGVPSIFLPEMQWQDAGDPEPVTVDGVAIPVPTVFGPKGVMFYGPKGVRFMGPGAVQFRTPTGGEFLQATHVGPFQQAYAAGAMSAGNDKRIFEFPGGAGDPTTDGGALAPWLGGTAAVPWEFDASGGVVDRAGIALQLSSAAAPSNEIRVKRVVTPSATVIGVSAGGTYAIGGGKVVVPMACAGTIKALVLREGGSAIDAGAEIVASPGGGLAVKSASNEVVVARAAQSAPPGAGAVECFLWVVSGRATS